MNTTRKNTTAKKKREQTVEIYPILKQRTQINTRDPEGPTYVRRLELGSNEETKTKCRMFACLLEEAGKQEPTTYFGKEGSNRHCRRLYICLV